MAMPGNSGRGVKSKYVNTVDIFPGQSVSRNLPFVSRQQGPKSAFVITMMSPKRRGRNAKPGQPGKELERTGLVVARAAI